MKQQTFIALGIAMAALVRVDAIIVTPMTFEQLVDEAVAAVYGRVAEVRGQWTSDRQSIDSLVTVDALRYLKGDLGDAVTLRLPGGEVGSVVNVLPGAPVLRPGDLVVLFLKARGPAIPTTLGLGQGIFRVARDPKSGAMLVTPPPLKESASGRIVRGAAERRALTLDIFAETVRARTVVGGASNGAAR